VKNKGILAAAFLLLSLHPIFAASKSREAADAAERGVAAYLLGHYQDALPDLETARDGGVDRGSLLYMLAFCYDNVRHDPEAARQGYDAAQKKLEAETAAPKPELESFFYLSNHLLNRHDNENSKRIALDALARIADHKLKVGKDGVSQFRAGKLHTDAGKDAEALEYYRRAIAAFKKDKSPPPAYLERSLEPVLRADTAKGDPKTLSEEWEKLLALNPNVADGQWNLAQTSLQAGRYAVARDAFKKAQAQGGDRSQEAYYAERLSDGAQTLVTSGFTIPTKDTDGKEIRSLSNDDLQERIKERGKTAAELLAREVKREEFDVFPPANAKARARVLPGAKLMTEFGEARKPVVALTIELVRRGLPLQESAFTGGYAPLIIQNWVDLWRSNHRALLDEYAKPDSAKPESTNPTSVKPK
jgi:tetratricopeptide (TPR) repeat protein